MQKCNHGCATVPESHRTSLRLLQISIQYIVYFEKIKSIYRFFFIFLVFISDSDLD